MSRKTVANLSKSVRMDKVVFPAILLCIAGHILQISAQNCTSSAQIDLCFLIDGSGSICDSDPGFDYATDNACNNWAFIVNFVYRFVTDLYIGPNDVRVAVVIFEYNASVKWNLTGYLDKNRLLEAINTTLEYRKGGQTNTSGGLNVMATQVFNTSADRPDALNMAIIITDGKPTNPSTVQDAIDRVHRSGIKTFAIGITHMVDEYTLRQLSSPPQQLGVTYFIVSDFSTIDTVRYVVLNQTCLRPTATIPSTTSTTTTTTPTTPTTTPITTPTASTTTTTTSTTPTTTPITTPATSTTTTTTSTTPTTTPITTPATSTTTTTTTTISPTTTISIPITRTTTPSQATDSSYTPRESRPLLEVGLGIGVPCGFIIIVLVIITIVIYVEISSLRKFKKEIQNNNNQSHTNAQQVANGTVQLSVNQYQQLGMQNPQQEYERIERYDTISTTETEPQATNVTVQPSLNQYQQLGILNLQQEYERIERYDTISTTGTENDGYYGSTTG